MQRSSCFRTALLVASYVLLVQGSALAQARIQRPQVVKPDRVQVVGRLLVRPDLVVSVEGPDRVVVGKSFTIKVVVKNQGNSDAPGSAGGGATYYFVDLVLSATGDLPVKLATYPAYAGATIEDFVEGMLLTGGRLSNTKTIPPGGEEAYSLPIYVPKKTPPGCYCLGAVVDPAGAVAERNENNNTACLRLEIAQTGMTGVTPAAPSWIMPYAVGGTPVNQITPEGTTNYTDGSGLVMNGAPFGSYLGFRHGYVETLPTDQIKYYRWLYRQSGETQWHEFSEPVGVHYSRRVGMLVSFPVYPLGPKSVGGKKLYEFRPHDPPLEPGAVTAWPTTDWFGDIYSGFLNTPGLADSLHQIRLEVFNSAGAPVSPGASTFEFIVPTGAAPDGTVLTRPAVSGTEVVGGGFVFHLRIDNRKCGAVIDAPSIGASAVADVCGFLLYNNKNSDSVRIAFHATHPAHFGVFSFGIVRGAVAADSAQGELTAAAAGAYTGNGSGDFSRNVLVRDLLGASCPDKAAFSENLYVYAKATTGWSHRISAYDASAVRAFALAPR